MTIYLFIYMGFQNYQSSIYAVTKQMYTTVTKFSPSLGDFRSGTQDRSLKKEQMQRHGGSCSLACCSWLAHPAVLYLPPTVS